MSQLERRALEMVADLIEENKKLQSILRKVCFECKNRISNEIGGYQPRPTGKETKNPPKEQ